MPSPVRQSGVPKEARRLLIIVIPAAIALWLALYHLLPPIPGTADPAGRMIFTLGCVCLAALFCLFAGIEAVAHERLQSPAFDPLSGNDTPRLIVNQRYLQNSVEQFLVFVPGLFGLAYYSPSPFLMRTVAATAILWILMRFAFWAGYHFGAAYRVFGVPGLMIPAILLLYDTARFGHDLAGATGAVAPVLLYILLEAFLFAATRARSPASGEG